MKSGKIRSFAALAAVLALAGACSADVLNMQGGLTSLQTVPVGNINNPADDTGFGAVGYGYNIGTYEVTAGQYCEFLNAVAASDQYGLWDGQMIVEPPDPPPGGWWDRGCNITRSGAAGSYSYSVPADWANRPVTYVSWADAARFANWLHNGQPAGLQDAATTEDGAYDMSGTHQYYTPTGGVTSYTDLDLALQAITRKAAWQWAVPSENEWYKAAYYDPAKGGGAGYWDYPTRSDEVPSNLLLDPDPGNNANFYDDVWPYGPVREPYFASEVGAFSNSEGAYGTFDMGGNVAEWNETIFSTGRRVRGGASGSFVEELHSSRRSGANQGLARLGFRLVQVPEPGSICTMLAGAVSVLLSGRRRSA